MAWRLPDTAAERLYEIDASLRPTGKRIAIGSGISGRGGGNGLNALCHHVAIQHYWVAARRHSMAVVGEVGRLGLYRRAVGLHYFARGWSRGGVPGFGVLKLRTHSVTPPFFSFRNTMGSLAAPHHDAFILLWRPLFECR